MKFAQNQAKAKQHPESELLPFYFLHPRYDPKIIRDIVKHGQKTSTSVFIWLMTMKMKSKMKNRSHRYGINRPSPIHRHKYTKYKMYLNMMMVTCIKEHLSRIWSSINSWKC